MLVISPYMGNSNLCGQASKIKARYSRETNVSKLILASGKACVPSFAFVPVKVKDLYHGWIQITSLWFIGFIKQKKRKINK